MTIRKRIIMFALFFGFDCGLNAMPLDSNVYYKLGTVDLQDNYNSVFGFSLSNGVPSGSILNYQLTIYSDPANGKIEVDNFGRSATYRTSCHWDRGGTSQVDWTNTLKYSVGDWAFITKADYSLCPDPNNPPPATIPTAVSRFTAGVANGGYDYKASSQRGWARVFYKPSQVTSTNQLSQPYAIKTFVVPIGSWLMSTAYGAAKFVSFAKSNTGINPARVMYFQTMLLDWDNNNNLFWAQNMDAPRSVNGVGPSTISGSRSAFEYEVNSTSAYGGNDLLNRGYTMVQSLSAECNDGSGGFSEANVGGRTVQAYVNQATTLSSYSGCHGTLNGIHVIENTGDDIWNGTDNFRYSYKGSHTGNSTVIARVDQLENTADWARAGIMLRTGTGTSDAYVGVFVTPKNGLIFQGRNSGGSTTTSQFGGVGGIKAPIWLKLAYNNSTHVTTAAYMQDGQASWTSISGQSSVAFGTYNVGLAAAGRSSYPNTSVYSNVSGM